MHSLESERRRRREEQWQKWERERHLRESEASRLRDLERHRPARVAELPPSASTSAHEQSIFHPVQPLPSELPSPATHQRAPPVAPPALVQPAAGSPPLPPPVGESPGPTLSPVTSAPLAPTLAPPSRSAKPTLPASRRFGSPVQSDDVRRFLAMDAAERFDLLDLNVLPLVELSRETASEEALQRRLQEKARDLLARVKQETDDLPVAGALLRELILHWYRDSPSLEGWSEALPSRWGGLFADSRSAGGKLQPWIVRRLLPLAQGARAGDPLARKLLRPFNRSGSVEHVLERPPAQTWAAEAAQAVLDDLATHPRVAGTSRIALVRLSELAQRRQVENVNQALSLLLDGPERGPFVLLHPNRYPDCELVAIRPPPPGASGPSLSYALVVQPVSAPSEGPVLGGGSSRTAHGDGAWSGGEGDEGGDPWEAPELGADAWGEVLEAHRRSKQHLPPPPKDYRQRPSYRNLRELLVRQPGSRRIFLSVKWRGRPAGLLLLASLLSEGKLAPEVGTDYEYLDAELSDLESGNPDRKPDPPIWSVPGGKVLREGDFQRGYRYRFEPAPPS